MIAKKGKGQQRETTDFWGELQLATKPSKRLQT
jgi:hypothetical protein